MQRTLDTTITFSDEQAMLLDTATEFFRAKAPITAVRAQLETAEGFERALWAEMVGLGWSGLAVPVEYGGSGLSLAEAVTITEPMGRHLFAAPFYRSGVQHPGADVGRRCPHPRPLLDDGSGRAETDH